MEIQPYRASIAELIQEQKPLTKEEKRILTKIRDKKLLFIGSSYATMVALLVFVLLKYWGDSSLYETEKQKLFRTVLPWFMLFLFTILTIYFINYYLKSVHPLVKDLKGGVKELLYFPAQGYKTPFFDGYYLDTPSRKNARIRVSKDFYQLITPNTKVCMSLSLHSRFVFYVEMEGRRIEFNEKNARVDN